MRTIKRTVRQLNSNKKTVLDRLCNAYAKEKQYWIDVLRAKKYQALLGSHREIRNEFVKKGYKSPKGLQARHWKLTLQDAAETWDKYWQALFVQLRQRIGKQYTVENERHYAYWLLKGYGQFIELMN